MLVRSKKFKEMKNLYGKLEFMFPMNNLWMISMVITLGLCAKRPFIFMSIKSHVGVIVFGK